MPLTGVGLTIYSSDNALDRSGAVTVPLASVGLTYCSDSALDLSGFDNILQ